VVAQASPQPSATLLSRVGHDPQPSADIWRVRLPRFSPSQLEGGPQHARERCCGPEHPAEAPEMMDRLYPAGGDQ
jgi:hypothetical protein